MSAVARVAAAYAAIDAVGCSEERVGLCLVAGALAVAGVVDVVVSAR